MLFGLVGFGAIHIPGLGGRNRVLLMLIGLLAIVASMPACGGSSGGVLSRSTQTLATDAVNTAGVPIKGLPELVQFSSHLSAR